MLILTRREGEELVLTHQGVTIRVKVTDIKGGQVKVGIEAPKDVEVVRGELTRYTARYLRNNLTYTPMALRVIE